MAADSTINCMSFAIAVCPVSRSDSANDITAQTCPSSIAAQCNLAFFLHQTAVTHVAKCKCCLSAKDTVGRAVPGIAWHLWVADSVSVVHQQWHTLSYHTHAYRQAPHTLIQHPHLPVLNQGSLCPFCIQASARQCIIIACTHGIATNNSTISDIIIR